MRVIAIVLRNPILLAGIAGALVICAAYAPSAWWLMFVALVPFIHAVRGASPRTLVLVGCIFGALLIGSATLATLWASVPGYAGAFGTTEGYVLVLSSWLLFFVPLIPTVIAWAFLAASIRSFGLWAAAVLSAAWVFLEWSRMIIFNIATYAPGVENPPFFSASALGYVIADNSSWLQLASLGGVYLMSGAVIGVNLMAYLFLRRKQWIRLALLGGSVLVISIVPIASIRASYATPSDEELTVGFVSLTSAWLHTEGRADIPFRMNEMPGALDLVVLPEGVSTTSVPLLFPQEAIRDDTVVLSTHSNLRGGILGNIAEVQKAGDTEPSLVRAKRILAAQGEYISGAFLLLARVTGTYTETLSHRMTSGSWGGPFMVGTERVPVSVLFCVEMLAPRFGKTQSTHDESALIALPMSHLQFRDAPTLKKDTLRFLKVRAVEAGVPIVASGNATPGYAIDGFGQILAEVGVDGISGSQVATIRTLSTRGK